jgi:hypothetical protein
MHQGQRLSFQRPGIRTNLQRGEVGPLVAGAAIEGCSRMLSIPLSRMAYKMRGCHRVRSEPADVAEMVFQYSNDLPGVCIRHGDVRFLYLESRRFSGATCMNLNSIGMKTSQRRSVLCVYDSFLHTCGFGPAPSLSTTTSFTREIYKSSLKDTSIKTPSSLILYLSGVCPVESKWTPFVD